MGVLRKGKCYNDAGEAVPVTLRTRKFIGTWLLIISLFVYPALATAVYVQFLTGAPQLILLIYFVIAGLGWMLPAGMIIKWMSTDPNAG